MANTSTLEPGIDERESIAGKASEMANRAKDKASEYGQAAVNKLDEQRGNAAETLESAADKIHETAETGSKKLAGTVHSAAEKIECAAAYLREHDTKQMVADVEGVIRRHPGQSLLAAAAVGFLVGRAFRND